MRRSATVACMSQEGYVDAPTPGRRPWLWIGLSGALALVAVLAVVFALTRSNPTPKPVVAGSATPTPSPAHLDEAAACALLIPAAHNGDVIIRDFIAHTDGSTVDQPTLNETVTDLNNVKIYGPPDLQTFVSDLLTPLAALQASLADHESRQVDTFAAELSTGALLDKCAPYGS